ncbi:hypothetical protein D3C76_1236260 [compost metagenome]
MATGYFIRLHDKTTCGGQVLEADNSVMMFGFAHAREGDRVSCGKDGKTYVIDGGLSHMISNGRRVAGTLDSVSGCPCKARLNHSITHATYQSRNDTPPPANRAAAQPTSTAATRSSPATPRHSNFAPATSRSNPAAFGMPRTSRARLLHRAQEHHARRT